MKKVLAFDFGASSGRAMLAQFVDGRITMEEIHRFTNDPVTVNGTMYWDVLRLFYEMKRGISKAVNMGGFDLICIDTWGIDFGLLDEHGQLIQNPVHYRDKRTDNFEELYKRIPREEIYAATGVQQIQINTIYQFDAILKTQPELLERADKMLFTPDLLNYFLTGEKKAEYTIASTSEMLNASARDWDYELLERVGIPRRILCDIVMPGTVCGYLSDEICEELGAPKAMVLCSASHDTASAVAATPTQEDEFVYISCGTWSLLGSEIAEPCLTEKARSYNYTNEGGVDRTIRFLKNIMGTWLIQESRRQWIREGNEYGFGEMEQMAKEAKPFQCFIDVDHPDFIKPGNIPAIIREHCKKSGQYVPQTVGEVVRCIDESLALKYHHTIMGMEDCLERTFKTVYILGGGTKSGLLCQMTANASGKPVSAGPDEATVLGNISVALIASGEIKDTKQAREIVKSSEEIKTYEPQDTAAWKEAYQRYCAVLTAK